MQKITLEDVARAQLELARGNAAGRSSETVFGGHEHAMRQTVVALVAEATLSEHENPGEATVQVLVGRVRLTAGQDSCEARSGDLVVVPDSRHSLQALEDAAIVLTAVPRAHIS